MKKKPDFYVVVVEAYFVEDATKHFTCGSFFLPIDTYKEAYRLAAKWNKMHEVQKSFEVLEKSFIDDMGIEVQCKCKVTGINYFGDTNLIDSTKLCSFLERA